TRRSSDLHHQAQHAVRRGVLRSEVDRVIGNDLVADGVGGVDGITLEHVAAMMPDLGGVGHASPPLGLRGFAGALPGPFSAFAVAGVLAFAAGFAFAPSLLVLAAALFATLPAPVCASRS